MTVDVVLVAHGTRNPRGLATVAELAAGLTGRLGPVRTAFVDVLGPNPREVLAEATAPAVVVPAFLASGYHVRTDLPARIAESGRRDVAVTRALGPDPVLAAVMRARLVEAGWRPGDTAVMAAAGSSDPAARRDLVRAANLLAARLGPQGSPVHLGFVATGRPTVAELVDRLRRPRRRVYIASYLLAPGVFADRLADAGADGVAAPLGAHPDLVALLGRRVVEARARRLSSTSRDSQNRR